MLWRQNDWNHWRKSPSLLLAPFARWRFAKPLRLSSRSLEVVWIVTVPFLVLFEWVPLPCPVAVKECADRGTLVLPLMPKAAAKAWCEPHEHCPRPLLPVQAVRSRWLRARLRPAG